MNTHELSNAHYHAMKGYIGSSMLKIFRRSPLEYYHRFITRRIPPPEQTTAMRMGTAVHAATLEPEKLERLLSVIPLEVLTTNGQRRGKAWDEWEAEHSNTVNVTIKEYDEVRWSVESIWANRRAADLLGASPLREHTLTHDVDDMRLKGRLDAIAPIECVITDVKRTNKRPDEFWRAVRDFGYHWQAAMYCRLFQCKWGSWPDFKFILVNDSAPFEVYVRSLPQSVIMKGHAENVVDLAKLKACLNFDMPWQAWGADVDCDLFVPEYSGLVATN